MKVQLISRAYYRNGVKHQKGDIIEISESEYSMFPHKFKIVTNKITNTNFELPNREQHVKVKIKKNKKVVNNETHYKN